MSNQPATIQVLHAPLERALRHIEAHLDQPLSVASLAEVAGFSPFHFARLFTSQVGESPMSYVRRRRLRHAARALASSPAPELVELAFDCGFESQEAFTRAFKQALGVTPGRFRRNNAALRDLLEMPMPTVTRSRPNPRLELLEGVRRRAAFRVAGFQASFDGPPGNNEIPEMWARLHRRLPLPGQAGGPMGGWGYGVCWCASAEQGSLNYLAGFEVAADAKLPADLASVEVPAQAYRVFRLGLEGGPLGPQIQAAMGEIFETRVPQAGWELTGGPDLEVYPADFNPTRPGATLELHVPVKG